MKDFVEAIAAVIILSIGVFLAISSIGYPILSGKSPVQEFSQEYASCESVSSPAFCNIAVFVYVLVVAAACVGIAYVGSRIWQSHSEKKIGGHISDSREKKLGIFQHFPNRLHTSFRG